jgi:SAM-dependent methyltransferase
MTASHLEFYTKHQISPVRQDIADLARHFERREALYRQLGVLPGFLRGRKVLEVGPGGGFNAVYTASLEPGRYVLVDGNPTGIEHMRALFARFPHWTRDVEIVQARIEDYRAPLSFDFVFCEGLLSGVPNPTQVLNSLVEATARGGVLVITCVDHLSHFPETLRRMFAQLAVSPEDDLEAKAQKILPMMAPHLRTLPGMSRRHDDWVVDNLIHPGSIIPLINTPEAIAALADRFDYYAGSPHFVTDWRWYKSIVGASRDFNSHAVEQYWTNAHNLLDYRQVLPPRPAAANKALYELCTRARRQLELMEQTGDRAYVSGFLGDLDAIVRDARSFSDVVADALAEARDLLVGTFDPSAVAEARKFGALFGRGQQYLSLSRKP